MPVTITAPVDDNGDLNFNRAEGIDLPVREYTDDGVEVDISELARYFTLPYLGFKKALAVDVDNALGRRLVLTVADLANVKSAVPFAVTDEDGVVPIVLWEGQIYERVV